MIVASSPVADRLLGWYDAHARILPWRYRPGERPDPYRVWLSEIMLQQTTVAAVKPYFQRFVTLWPSVVDLAAAPAEDVMTAWAGLGYYSRARNLHAGAKMVAERLGGAFPADEAALRAIPGVGPYTAAAVAAIAFGLKATPVDGNIERVMARRHAVETPLPAAKPRLKELAAAATPDDRAGDFAQALMDLGATICTPRSPACAICPIADDCLGRKMGIEGQLPARAAKASRPERYGAAFVAVSDAGNMLLRRRPPRGLLGGMMEIPSSGWESAPPADPLAAAPLAGAWRKTGAIEHVFTHFRLTLDVYVAQGVEESAAPGMWTPLQAIEEAGLPSVMRKVVAAAARDDADRRPRRRRRIG